jgi:D-tyrosyl-tRNA(Tyr) deacylase
MIAVLQRVSEARVDRASEVVGSIGPGLLVLLGVATGDSHKDADYLAGKVTQLRIFPDDQHRMNRSVIDVSGGILVVSQFTLLGDCRKGRRPSFDAAASPDLAQELYEYFVSRLRETVTRVETGIFRATMQVHLTNDGPVTFILDSKSV